MCRRFPKAACSPAGPDCSSDNGYWGPQRMRRTFVLEIPETPEPILFCQDFPVRISDEGRELGGSIRVRRAAREGKRLLLFQVDLPRSFRESGFLRSHSVLIERVDFVLRFYHGPPRAGSFSFTGPFTAGATMEADGGAPYTLKAEQDPRSGARFRLLTRERYGRGDTKPLFYDTAGRRQLLHLCGGSWGSRGADINFDAHGVALERIAKVVFGERPQQRTFADVRVKYRDIRKSQGVIVDWITEFIIDGADGREDQRGLYSLIRYKFLRRWWLEGGYSLYSYRPEGLTERTLSVRRHSHSVQTK